MRCARGLRVASAIVLICVAVPWPVTARCVVFSLDENLARDTYVAIFSGAVQHVENVAAGEVAAFAVDSVWKGQVSARTIIYNRQTPGASEQIAFVPRMRYFVMAYPVVAESRASFGLPAEGGGFLASGYCSTYEFDKLPNAKFKEDVHRIRSHPPRRTPG